MRVYNQATVRSSLQHEQTELECGAQEIFKKFTFTLGLQFESLDIYEIIGTVCHKDDFLAKEIYFTAAGAS